MIIESSGASSGGLTKREVPTSEIEYLIANCLTAYPVKKNIPEQRTESPSVGTLFRSGFTATFSCGHGSDGSRWGFSLFGHSIQLNSSTGRTHSHRGVDYELTQFLITVPFFTVISLSRSSPLARERQIIDLCLPLTWCESFWTLHSESRDGIRPAHLEFAAALASRVSTRNGDLSAPELMEYAVH